MSKVPLHRGKTMFNRIASTEITAFYLETQTNENHVEKNGFTDPAGKKTSPDNAEKYFPPFGSGPVHTVEHQGFVRSKLPPERDQICTT